MMFDLRRWVPFMICYPIISGIQRSVASGSLPSVCWQSIVFDYGTLIPLPMKICRNQVRNSNLLRTRPAVHCRIGNERNSLELGEDATSKPERKTSRRAEPRCQAEVSRLSSVSSFSELSNMSTSQSVSQPAGRPGRQAGSEPVLFIWSAGIFSAAAQTTSSSHLSAADLSSSSRSSDSS